VEVQGNFCDAQSWREWCFRSVYILASGREDVLTTAAQHTAALSYTHGLVLFCIGAFVGPDFGNFWKQNQKQDYLQVGFVSFCD
jgi:hypothetical protein